MQANYLHFKTQQFLCYNLKHLLQISTLFFLRIFGEFYEFLMKFWKTIE